MAVQADNRELREEGLPQYRQDRDKWKARAEEAEKVLRLISLDCEDDCMGAIANDKGLDGEPLSERLRAAWCPACYARAFLAQKEPQL